MGTSQTKRAAAAAAAGALLLLPLSACSADETNTGSSVLTSAGEAAESAADDAGENVDCSGDSCSVTLSSGSEVDVLNTTIAFRSAADGEATLDVGDEMVSCTEGESVSAGPLELECSTVTDDEVTLTATLG